MTLKKDVNQLSFPWVHWATSNGPHFYPRLSGAKREQRGGSKNTLQLLIFFGQPIPASPLLCGPQSPELQKQPLLLPSRPLAGGPHRPPLSIHSASSSRFSAGLCWSLPIWEFGTDLITLASGRKNTSQEKLALHFSFSKRQWLTNSSSRNPLTPKGTKAGVSLQMNNVNCSWQEGDRGHLCYAPSTSLPVFQDGSNGPGSPQGKEL